MQTYNFFQRWLVRGGNSMNLKQQIPTGESAEKEYSFERKGTN